MSYPNVHFGNEGEQYNTYSTERWPVGTKMMLQDGRTFQFAKAGAVALAAGVLCQSEVPDADHDTLAVAAAGAVGDKFVTITNGVDTIEANLYAGGYLCVEAAAGTGEGVVYKIANAHDAIANATNGTIPLERGLAIALNTSSTVTLVKHPCRDILIHPSPPTANVVGVTATAIAANKFGWIQTGGVGCCLIDGTVVIGQSVMPSNGTDGSVKAWGLTEGAPNVEITPAIGRVVEVAPTGDSGLINLIAF